MTAKELAAELSGRKYGMEIDSSEEQEAKDAGLVVVDGCSDDNVELRGAIDSEVGAWNGTTLYITPTGMLEEPTCDNAATWRIAPAPISPHPRAPLKASQQSGAK